MYKCGCLFFSVDHGGKIRMKPGANKCSMILIYKPLRSTEPPSNSVQSDFPHSEPASGNQICLDDLDMTDLLSTTPPFCSSQTGRDDCTLCLDHTHLYTHTHTHTQSVDRNMLGGPLYIKKCLGGRRGVWGGAGRGEKEEYGGERLRWRKRRLDRG